MPGYFGFGSLGRLYSPQSPLAPVSSQRKRLTAADLLSTLAIAPDYPPEPAYPNTPEDLPEDLQRRLKQNRMLAMYASGGAAMGSGRMGSAMLAGVLGERDRETTAVEDARERMKRDYLLKRKEAETTAERRSGIATREKEAQDLSTMLESIYSVAAPEGKAPDQTVIDQAEAAARSGSRQALVQLMETAKQNRSLLDAGVSPYDQSAVDKYKFEQKRGQQNILTEDELRLRRQFERPREPAPAQFDEARGIMFDPNTKEITRVPGYGKPTEDELWRDAIAKATTTDRDTGERDVDIGLARKIFDATKAGPAGGPAAAAGPVDTGGPLRREVRPQEGAVELASILPRLPERDRLEALKAIEKGVSAQTILRGIMQDYPQLRGERP